MLNAERWGVAYSVNSIRKLKTMKTNAELVSFLRASVERAGFLLVFVARKGVHVIAEFVSPHDLDSLSADERHATLWNISKRGERPGDPGEAEHNQPRVSSPVELRSWCKARGYVALMDDDATVRAYVAQHAEMNTAAEVLCEGAAKPGLMGVTPEESQLVRRAAGYVLLHTVKNPDGTVAGMLWARPNGAPAAVAN